MATKKFNAYKKRAKVAPDMPDTRDWLYEPTLRTIQYPELSPPKNIPILDQGEEGACAGFGLAAVINILKRRANRGNEPVSARMLYKLALHYDEWPGEDYDDGTSIRAAISAWRNNGVCLDKEWRSISNPKPDYLTVRRAKEARKCTPGAYYRIEPKISHFHAALQETGAIYVSAEIHDGWDIWYHAGTNPPVIQPAKRNSAHAFAIVGYNERGFFVQNSWGEDWGLKGLAVWTYEDWIESIMDAWVVQLAYPTPSVFRKTAAVAFLTSEEAKAAAKQGPARHEIDGHFVHIDDGRFHSPGKYGGNARHVNETARYLANETNYKHLLFYAHGGLNSPDASARRIAAMKQTFINNGIYPFHFMYDTGVGEELKDLLAQKFSPFDRRTGSFLGGMRDSAAEAWGKAREKLVAQSDRILENAARRPGTALWKEIKEGTREAFEDRGAGTVTLASFLDALKDAGAANAVKIHLVGHSTGAIWMGQLLWRLRKMGVSQTIDSLSLYAPACTVDFFNEAYAPVLGGTHKKVVVKKAAIYCLRKKQEEDDSVGPYRKSLLYMVSNACEGRTSEQVRTEGGEPLVGMQAFHAELPALGFDYVISGSRECKSATHGGFDNDPATMNDTLRRVLGREPNVFFTETNLQY